MLLQNLSLLLVLNRSPALLMLRGLPRGCRRLTCQILLRAARCLQRPPLVSPRTPFSHLYSFLCDTRHRCIIYYNTLHYISVLFCTDGKFSEDAAAQGNGSDLLNLGDLSSCLKSMMKGTGGKHGARQNLGPNTAAFISTFE